MSAPRSSRFRPHPLFAGVFYYLAYSEGAAKIRESLAQQIGQLAQVQTKEEHDILQSLEGFFQCYKEFACCSLVGPVGCIFFLVTLSFD
jgi:hypothetical protein